VDIRTNYSVPRSHPNEAFAFARVLQLQRQGIWPGVWTDGISYYLTYDPVFDMGDDE
jgi:hypothetical protein